MNNQNVIKRFSDVREVATKILGKCVCVRVDEPHAKGFTGAKLVVGFKLNPIFDPNANPDQPGLKPAERTLLKQQANPRTADVRVIWLRPGITVQELIDEHLSPIKKSLDKRTPVTSLEARPEPKPEKTDEELAEMLEKGEVDSSIIDDGMDEEDGYEVPEIEDDEDAGKTDSAEDETDEFIEDEDGDIIEKKERPKSELSEVIAALEVMGQNIQTVHNDVKALNNRVAQVEKAKPAKKTSKKK